MKYLIVNADDFGASRGINRAIVELEQAGALTSTSLMISMPATRDATRLARKTPSLDIGLHAALTNEDGSPLVDFNDRRKCEAELQRQMDRFAMLLDRLPSHIDSHQNVHRDARLRPLFLDIAQRYGIPMREHSVVRYFPDFYGQWEGEPHPEHISIDSLLGMLDRELREGITELSCHPGYCGRDFRSQYDMEREIEHKTLADPRFLDFLDARGVRLCRFSDLASLPREPAVR
jgi:chitin disaccharide deacetylase